jgi:hypothetical protein
MFCIPKQLLLANNRAGKELNRYGPRDQFGEREVKDGGTPPLPPSLGRPRWWEAENSRTKKVIKQNVGKNLITLALEKKKLLPPL